MVQPGGKGYLLQTESIGAHPKWQVSVDGSEQVLSESANRHVHAGNKHCIVPPLWVDHTLR